MNLASKVAARYAKILSDAEFTKLMKWLGPKALKAHMAFPRGRREFDTDTRDFIFNISPRDYLTVPVADAKRMMRDGTPLRDIVNPKAYAAMKDVLETLRNRRLRFKMVKAPWDHGGSYILAEMPRPKTDPGKVDPRTWMS